MVRYARTTPPNYLPGFVDNALMRLADLEDLTHVPGRPAVALPTEEVEVRASGQHRVFTLLALGL